MKNSVQRFKGILVTAILAFTYETQAFALPVASSLERAAALAAPVSNDFVGSEINFTAIIALDNCSGSLVRFTTSQPSDNAMVLTNGHCLEGGFAKPGDAIVNKTSTRSFRLLNANASSTLATFRASKIMYATMTGTDISLYRLTITYAEIESKHHVQALTISDRHPSEGDPIHIVSGFWRKIYSCKIDDFIFKLKEDKWTMSDSIRYSQPGCATIGGTSGSPIINSDTKEVIAINNTGNEDGERCTMNNPCEEDESGRVTVKKGASYGQQTHQIYSCLNIHNDIDLSMPGCKLTKPATRALQLVSERN